MADYDVGATGLAQPPTSAVVTTYRPAVAVRNNGIHDALASGVLRIYRGGLLVFTSEIYSPTIPPGETRNAEAVLYWTPGELGDYYVSADVTCPLDQVESNNHLAPVKVTVGPGEPPVPPVVTMHAAQHEEGGTDQLSIDGLRGECFDPQPPKDHVSRHEQGGSDELSVSGLHGTLADAQPTAAHGNEKHSVTFATADQLAAHLDDGTNVHSSAANLEQTTNKGNQLGYAGLDSTARVALENLGADTDAARGEVYEECDRNTTTEIVSASWPTGKLNHDGLAIEVDVHCYYRASAPGTPSVLFEMKQAGAVWSTLAQPTITLDPSHPDFFLLEAHLRAVVYSTGGVYKLLPVNRILAIPRDGTPRGAHDAIATPNFWADEPLTVKASLVVDDVVDAYGAIFDGVIRTRHPRAL